MFSKLNLFPQKNSSTNNSASKIVASVVNKIVSEQNKSNNSKVKDLETLVTIIQKKIDKLRSPLQPGSNRPGGPPRRAPPSFLAGIGQVKLRPTNSNSSSTSSSTSSSNNKKELSNFEKLRSPSQQGFNLPAGPPRRAPPSFLAGIKKNFQILKNLC